MGAIRRCARGALLFATTTTFAVLSAKASFAQQSATKARVGEGGFQLRVASMSAAGARNEAPVETPAAWRHTFGSERRAEGKRRPVPFSADVVVLQDVANLGPVKQMLPARSYQVAASRQILENAKPDQQRSQVTTTAIAVSRSAGLRAVGQEHLLEIAEPPAGTSLPLSAAIAVNLRSGSGSFWVMALDVSPCPGGSTEDDVHCAAAKRQLDLVDAWVSAKLAAGETVIVAGRFHKTLGNDDLPGKLDNLARLPQAPEIPETCVDESGRIARTYVLAAASQVPSESVKFQTKLEPIDDQKPEMGCALVTDVRF